MLRVRDCQHIYSVMDGRISYLVGAAKGEGLFIVARIKPREVVLRVALVVCALSRHLRLHLLEPEANFITN